MNCKPGQMAWIYDPPNGINHRKIVCCEKLHPMMKLTDHQGNLRDVQNVWEVSPSIPVYYDANRLTNLILDRALRPIDNPGDDEKDQSAAWLPPVPTSAKNNKKKEEEKCAATAVTISSLLKNQ